MSDNQLGEKDQRTISVYLPPSYFTSDTRYPVVYYLPSYTDTSMMGFSPPGDADNLRRRYETATPREAFFPARQPWLLYTGCIALLRTAVRALSRSWGDRGAFSNGDIIDPKLDHPQ